MTVAERKIQQNYSHSTSETKRCSKCKNVKSGSSRSATRGRCSVGSFAVAVDGVCDVFARRGKKA